MSDIMLGQQALKTASVNGLFTLPGLCNAMSLPAEDMARRDAIWRVLGPVSDEHITNSGVYYWQIGPDARRVALRQFYALPHLQQFIKGAVVHDDGNIDDPFSVALVELLKCSRISFDDPGTSADVTALNHAIVRAAAILDAVQFAQEVPALLGHTFQVRASANETYSPMPITALARFADAQITDLQARSDLRIVIPNTHFGYTPEREKISKFARGKGVERPLLLTGIGGAGKSALLSRLMLGWQRSAPDMIQILLDFDRRQLSLGEPIEILQEVFRQITGFLRLQHEQEDEALREGLKTLRQDISLYKTDQQGERASNSFQLSYALRLLSQLQEDWAKPLQAMPIVLVLDTFEAIDRMAVYHRQFTEFAPESYKGNEVVSQIMQILRTMQDQYLPNMRVIVSGREEPLSDAELDEWFGPRVRLDGLYSVSGAKLLQSEAARLNPVSGLIFQDDAKARQVSRLLGGHPLAIIAFAKYIDRNPGDVDDLIAELEAEGGFAAEFAQVFLYTRILNRITDPDVRPLAHPGLMLRFIDADIILNVLADPCLDRGEDTENPLTAPEADTLFTKLRNQYWLVNPVQGSDAQVKHIPELRRLMLPGLLAGPGTSDKGQERTKKLDLQRRAREVCRAATTFFDARDQGTDRLDALYYGAFNTGPPENFTKALAQELDRHLGEDVATMPVGWRAVIRHLLGLDLSQREADALAERYQQEESKRAMAKIQQTGSRVFTKGMAGRESAKAKPAAKKISNPKAKVVDPQAEWSNLSVLQQSHNIQASWADATPNMADRAMWFLEGCVKAVALPNLDKDLLRIEQDIQREPFGNAVYISVLLGMTDHTPRMPRSAPIEDISSDYPETLRHLLKGAANAERMNFGAAAEALRDYLLNLEVVFPVTSNRRVATQMIHQMMDEKSKPDLKMLLSMPGMSLAAGSRQEFERLRLGSANSGKMHPTYYQQLLAPLTDKYQQDDLYLSDLERFYRTDQTMSNSAVEFAQMTRHEQVHFMTMLRGLNPELYAPTIALLSGLDFHAGEAVVLDTAHDLALWPKDLQFDDQQIYSSTDASVVVETADRCGALRLLLQNIAQHEPFAERLIAIYDMITQVYFSGIEEYLAGPETR